MTSTDPVRLKKSALFASLGYEPHPGQVEIHRSKAPRRVVASGARFGKSTVGAYEAIAAVLEPRDRALGWVIAPHYELTRLIFRKVVEVLHERLAHRIVSFDERAHTIVVVNLGGGRTELRAKSADSAVSLLGESCDFVILDEAAQLRDDIWNEHVSQRLIDRRGWALILSTPAGGGWFREVFKRGQRGRDPAFQSWSMPSWVNPHLPRDLIEAEKLRLPKDVFDEMYGAKFVNVPIETCETCLGPRENACSILLLRGDEPEPRCKECGDLVDKAGVTVVPIWEGKRGTPIVIRLEDHLDYPRRAVDLPRESRNPDADEETEDLELTT